MALEKLSKALQGAVEFTFKDAKLNVGGVVTGNNAGGFSSGDNRIDCKAKIDHKVTKSPNGATVVISRLIILAKSISQPPKSKNVLHFGTEDEPSGETYSINDVTMDGLESHYICTVSKNGES